MKTFKPHLLLTLALAAIVSTVTAQEPADAQQTAEEEVSKDLTAKQYPRYYYSNQTRKPGFTILFNSEVSVEEAAQNMFFEDKEGRAVTVDVQPATEQHIANHWKYYGGNDNTSPPAKQFLTVWPSRPLPVGQYWKLVVTDQLKSKDGELSMPRRVTYGAGTVRPFQVTNSYVSNPYNETPTLRLYFSKPIDPKVVNQLEDRFVKLSPRPENFRMKTKGQGVTFYGDFKYGTTYNVNVTAGLMAQDGLEMEKPYQANLLFEPREAFITLPDYDVAQPRNGEGTFRILSGNMEKIRVRVKELKGDSLVYAMRGYKVYDPDHVDWEVGQKLPAYEMVAGKTIHDHTYEMKGKVDTTEDLELKWEDIVPSGSSAGLYVSVEGDSRSHPNIDSHRVGAHSIVQLTDLGVAWKKSSNGSLFYVFSLRSGKPVPNTEVALIDDDNQTLNTYSTGADGTVQVPMNGPNAETQWVIAKTQDDRYGTSFDPNSQQGLSTWRFNVRQLYWGEPSTRLRTYIFSDRDIYKPGETVFLKAIARVADGEELAVPNDAKGFPATLRVTDGRGREILEREVEFTANGTVDFSFGLPPENYGYYQVRFDFEDIVKGFSDDEEEQGYDQYAYHGFNVADYRPNTFEVGVEAPGTVTPDADKIEVELKANYYRGKPLSKAQVNWYASYHPSNFRPSGFSDYIFGEWNSDNNWTSDANTVELGEEGKTKVNLDFIPRESLEQPVRVSFNADVTDINQQTISQSSSFLVHSSPYYLGMKLPNGWLEVGDKINIEALPVTAQGDAMDANLNANLLVERKVWNTIKVEAADGEMRHRNEWSYEKIFDGPFAIESKEGNPAKKTIDFEQPGQYRFTLTTENDGKVIKTVGNRYIYGDNDYWWAQKDGDAIDLVTETKDYTVGDTARILVRSPILGTALITTERAGVYRTIQKQLTSKNEFIDIPISSQDAPNLFVSVLVIRGSADSTHRFQDTDYRIGYTELKVHRPSDHLEVDIEVAQEEILPQDEVEVTATITDYQGEPVRNAEVTLYAVDEGVLSLTNYQNPEPSNTFLAPYPLLVRTWHTLFDVLPENPDERSYSNKGLLIGGGAEGLAALTERARKDFRATAYWNGSLMTDGQGRAKATFKAPDSLTEFRISAVALNRADQYGVGTNKMTVTKPIIIEPALPAFANVGDEHLLRAVLHNTTDKSGKFEVTLQADERIELMAESFKVTPAALESPIITPQLYRKTIDLGPGKTTALPIPVKFNTAGEAKWTWTIRDLNEDSAKNRSDSIETKFDVGYPVPLLREMHHVKINPNEPQNLLASFGDDLMNGLGEIDMTLSNSRLLEAQDAVNYNLQYPYGCVEQTTSSTLPWLTMGQLSEVFPSLDKDKEKRDEAINYGLNRVLSMQTSEGGLGYWPGADYPELWASAWGGFGLVTGYNQGYDLPKERLDNLWKWMSENLRDSEDLKEPYDLHQRCVALYTLALAGHPEPAYHELMNEKREFLAPESRAFLALAILEGGTNAQRALVPSLLEDDPKAPKSAAPWYGKGMPVSAKLIAQLKMDPKSGEVDSLLTNLLALRKPPYGWGSTYANAWPLVALSKVAETEAKPNKTSRAILAWKGEKHTFELGKSFESQNMTFTFDGDAREEALEVVSSKGEMLHVNLELSSYPNDLSTEPQNKGFKISRSYHKLNPDGTMDESTNFTIGDLVVVHLEVDIPNDNEIYIAVDDPLPSVFEAINPAFENRANKDAPLNRWEQLPRNYEEIRFDRALFFSNQVYNKGTYKVEYLARVVASGAVTAPPAKIEAMYEPQRHGLSATQRITATLPADKPAEVATK